MTNHIAFSRRTFLPMSGTYLLGVFNDHFFKETVILLAFTVGLSELQSPIIKYFSLPFILFSAYAGYFADRFPKRNVVIVSKYLELIAMGIGAVGMVTLNFPLMVAMVFVMALQSTLFGPALNGAIPELFAPTHVTRVNALLKMITTISIIMGIMLAGMLMDIDIHRFYLSPVQLLAGVVIAVSISGVILSYRIKSRPAPADQFRRPFPWKGPIQSLMDAVTLRHSQRLLRALLGSTFFYFASTLVLASIHELCLTDFGFTNTFTGALTGMVAIGVASGSLFSIRLSRHLQHEQIFVPAALAFGLMLILAAQVSHHPLVNEKIHLAASLFFSGAFGGMFLIPLLTYIQITPGDGEKGKVISINNFLDFSGIFVAGELFGWLHPVISATDLLWMTGVFAIIVAAIFRWHHQVQTGKGNISNRPHRPVSLSGRLVVFLLQWILKLRYRVVVNMSAPVVRQGSSGILFVANHPALIDPIIVMSRLYSNFQPRPLADESQMKRPGLRHLFRMVAPVLIPDVKTDGRNARFRARAAIDSVINALNAGDNILLYPAGRIYRAEHEYLGANSAVETILNRVPDATVVMIRTSGLFGSAFSRASGNPPKLRHIFPKAIVSLLGAGIFFLPRRTVTIDITPSPDFPRHASRLEMNRYMENFFNTGTPATVRVPYMLYGKSRIDTTPGTTPSQNIGTKSNRDRGVLLTHGQRSLITGFIKQKLQLDQISHSHSLSMDLGMDSILKMELALWIEQEFHVPPIAVESLETVQDCYEAASGGFTGSPSPDIFPDAAWWRPSATSLSRNAELRAMKGDTIARLFIQQAKTTPNRPIIADPLRGTLTYRQLLTAIFALKPHIASIKGDRVGIMLPASTGAVITYLATMFAGKTPVMFNFTAGIRAVTHGIATTGTRAILTSSLFLNKLNAQGIDYRGTGATLMALEDISKRISLSQRIRAAISARLGIRYLENSPISAAAAILFTSGSEALPKAVPLTHRNIIANFRDFSSALHLKSSDRLLGILPPFHSFGLTGTIVMPLCMGLKTVYFPNPTDSGSLAGLIENAQITCLLSTPTFLKSILQQPANMASIRLTFVGAEKCPAAVYRLFTEKCPNGVLCEGYGITECSPVISMNPVRRPIRETIGQVLASIRYAIVDDALQSRVVPGNTGTLLVAGDNVFTGYLKTDHPDTDIQSPFVQFEHRTWFNTGDMVRALPDNTLVFEGRKKRFVKVAGEMISLPAVEAVLRDAAPYASELQECAVATRAANSMELVLFSTAPVTVQAINDLLRQSGLSSLHRISKVIHLDELPKLGSGKIDYRALQASDQEAA
jgi:acyl-[acyl-carrier-protein]-phospholipid O-acyltransferase / long-chain-fatty-acid--[acyl-carrier-protein] ligase